VKLLSFACLLLTSSAALFAGTAPVATPEPSTYLIVGGALVAGAWLHNRRNNNRKK
jgi:hypothetical protein